jgi:hypothetical protein
MQPAAPEPALVMGVPAGVVTRSLDHHYQPSLWPAVTWVGRGELAVHLGHSTGVHGAADGAIEWVTADGALVTLDAPLTALRLTQVPAARLNAGCPACEGQITRKSHDPQPRAGPRSIRTNVR